MADSNIIKINLQTTGSNSGTWGTITNENLQKVEETLKGFIAVPITGATTTLSNPSGGNGLASQTAKITLKLTGVKRFVQQYQEQTKSNAKIETIEEMQTFVDAYPEFRKLSGNTNENIIKDSDAVMQKLTGHRNTFVDKIGLPLSTILSNEYDFLKNGTENNLSKIDSKALVRYRMLSNEMINNNVIFDIPFKNSTLSDKKNQIKNFNSCLDKFYTFAKNHNWINQSKATYDFWNKEHIC